MRFMLKLVIADDDKLALEHLEHIVDWESFNISLVGAFSSSSDLLEYIKHHHTDIVISDIKMSNPDGLEIAKFCSLNYPHISVILISAFRNFEYAQKAILHGVVTYVLKPYTSEDITNAIYAALRKIDHSPDNRPISDFMNNTIYQKLFSDIYCDLYESYGDIISVMDSLYLCDSEGFVLNFEIDDFQTYINGCWSYGLPRLSSALATIAYYHQDNSLFCMFAEKEAQFSVIALGASKAEADDYTTKLIENIKDILQADIKLLSITHFNSVTELPSFYNSSSYASNELADKINSYIDKNYMNDMSLDAIAKYFGFSKEYFCSLYKKLTGQNLTDTIQEVRLSKACDLLINSNLKIAQIANMVGYKSQSYFVRLFKSHFDATPSEYREIYSVSDNTLL